METLRHELLCVALYSGLFSNVNPLDSCIVVQTHVTSARNVLFMEYYNANVSMMYLLLIRFDLLLLHLEQNRLFFISQLSPSLLLWRSE